MLITSHCKGEEEIIRQLQVLQHSRFVAKPIVIMDDIMLLNLFGQIRGSAGDIREYVYHEVAHNYHSLLHDKLKVR